MNTSDTTTTTLLAQLRTVLDLTHTEIQIAETRTVQARTEAVRRELCENADNGRARAAAIEAAIRELGGVPELIGPFLGRAAAAVKALVEQAQPFDEALLGDLTLEHQLLDRARYIKALAVAAGNTDVENLAFRLIAAHSATVDWLTTVLAEDALGGPAALRRTPLQAAAGTAVRLVNVPVIWSARGLDWALDTVRATPPALSELLERGTRAGDVAVKTLTASRDAALETAEQVTRREGADGVAEVLHSARTAAGVLEPGELPIDGYDDLNVSEAVAAVKELTEPADVRAIVAYEEAHKNRHGVVSASQTRLAAIAQDVVGLS
ncbi:MULTISPECIES: ferritin-like domain-containing protein [Rhodococcus]|uniref:ferritin-like domain-containing protein n=1 Tax=Rhodococcus TaxID=1827 RepID=UPI0029538E45|nr:MULTISPECIES: ferritin-like domain-containing protein [Rhodococcus]MDV7246723.1 ferritin-like domain-containing protein [Rhodococcus oxybenzonivorans]MDV7337736.1 ferritin-like domain-containing protein [Rhodococcus oxybenzonivorans]MDV7347792.1 ferritin-like domain-containing protein [Rhodococcus oxybenzonivorans]MDV8031500.1 ferritin-like domain-containing protein [Rhodococcus sp. IEGM 27]